MDGWMDAKNTFTTHGMIRDHFLPSPQQPAQCSFCTAVVSAYTYTHAGCEPFPTGQEPGGGRPFLPTDTAVSSRKKKTGSVLGCECELWARSHLASKRPCAAEHGAAAAAAFSHPAAVRGQSSPVEPGAYTHSRVGPRLEASAARVQLLLRAGAVTPSTSSGCGLTATTLKCGFADSYPG